MLMDAFDWKNGLFIMVAVMLNCVVCGALMRPLVPTKKPRKKNFFDRFVSFGDGIMNDIVTFLCNYEQQKVTVWGYEWDCEWQKGSQYCEQQLCFWAGWLACCVYLSIVDTGSVRNNMKMFVSFDRLRSTSTEDPGASQKWAQWVSARLWRRPWKKLNLLARKRCERKRATRKWHQSLTPGTNHLCHLVGVLLQFLHMLEACIDYS